MRPRSHQRSHARDLGARQRGFSILEIFVALAIGGIVLLGLTDVMVTSKVSHLREENLARLQDAGRFGTQSAAKATRSARGLACYVPGSPHQTVHLRVKACSLLQLPSGTACNSSHQNTQYHVLGAERPLGYDASEKTGGAWLGGLPVEAKTDVGNAYLRGDVLVSWGIAGPGVSLSAAVPPPGTDRISVSSSTTFKDGTVALITDCNNADVFMVGGGATVPGGVDPPGLAHGIGGGANVSTDLSAYYNWRAANATQQGGRDYPALVYPLRYEVWFICCVDRTTGSMQSGTETARCNTAAADYRPALCRWDINWRRGGKTQAMMPDVADLRLTFSGDLDEDGVPDFFADDSSPVRTAAWVSATSTTRTARSAWTAVTGVNVELLVTGADDGLSMAKAARAPTDAAWPPTGASATDRLGNSLPTDRRLYQRFVINLAIRGRAPSYLR